MPHYEYRNFRNPRSLRVLELLPAGNAEAPLRIRLHHTSIDAYGASRIKYEALSYVWGTTRGTRPVYCVDREILVTSNCESALRHLRQVESSRLLWIDAICINQSADDVATSERNVQVKMMSEIFANASRVLVWLGDAPEKSNDHIMRRRWLDNVGLSFGQAMRYLVSGSSSEQEKQRLRSHLQLQLGLLELMDSDSDDTDDEEDRRYQALEEILYFFDSNPWFYRIWTLLEITFARDALVLIGDAVFTWNQIETSWLKLGIYLQNRQIQGGLQSRDWLRLYLARTMIQSRLSGDAISDNRNDFLILNQLYDHEASDPKDMVFAMQPIWEQLGLKLPRPDYRKPFERLYEETAVAIMRETGSLEICVQCRVPTKPHPDLPSWVPDWSQGIGLRYDDPKDVRSHEFYFAPSLDLFEERGKMVAINRRGPYATRHSKYTPPTHRATGHLPVTGYRLGTISGVRPFIHLRERIVTTSILDLLEDWVKKVEIISTNLDGINDERRTHDEFFDWLRMQHCRDPKESSKTDLLYGQKAFASAIQYRLRVGDQSIFHLSPNLIGVAESDVRNGDIVTLIHGSDFPLVFRPQGQHFHYVCCAYVWGAMQGGLWPEIEPSSVGWGSSTTLFDMKKLVRKSKRSKGTGLEEFILI